MARDSIRLLNTGRREVERTDLTEYMSHTLTSPSIDMARRCLGKGREGERKRENRGREGKGEGKEEE